MNDKLQVETRERPR